MLGARISWDTRAYPTPFEKVSDTCGSSIPALGTCQVGVAFHPTASHPSLPNYLWLASGSADGITADVCGVTVSNDNIVREMAGAGVSWKSYQEGLPSVGFLGCSSGNYAEKHNPFAYFSDVQNNSVQARPLPI